MCNEDEMNKKSLYTYKKYIQRRIRCNKIKISCNACNKCFFFTINLFFIYIPIRLLAVSHFSKIKMEQAKKIINFKYYTVFIIWSYSL